MKEDISLWIAIIIAFFLVLGSGFALIGTIGLLRFSNFYERLHMSSLGANWGVGSILIASFLYSIFVNHRFVIHEILLMIFFIVTIPITSMLISQATAYRNYLSNYLEESLAFLLDKTKEKSSKEEKLPD
ncbi:monovalent cation/H(+) antiporter subunit G [Bartonella sp. F02]|uniref:monovalent cation/H(+) antiporter subunit G n=1 Tax=Bartonella sp. F02 TaxID=2967262 RepID=UPI0022A98EDB|nr:monovalent cation/H(+) antiporter subunit G [Bartonella sp. F02]MCZ2327901.1 monovalent cation/H(+) antiporter subunit G [Bartonella sp. F02]